MFTHIVRWIYLVSAWLILIAVIVQFFLAGLGVFAGAANFQIHADFGYTIFFLMLIVLLIALAARLPWRTIGVTVLLPVLVVLQSFLIEAGQDGLAYIAALHVVNGLAIFSLAGFLAVRSNRFVTTEKFSTPKVLQPDK